MVGYSGKLSNDEEADMCVAEWSWGSKSKPFVIGFLITCCKKNKLNCQVVMLYHRRNISKSMYIVNGTILILMLLMIAMFSVDKFNRP
jgi:hypothetical protein